MKLKFLSHLFNPKGFYIILDGEPVSTNYSSFKEAEEIAQKISEKLNTIVLVCKGKERKTDHNISSIYLSGRRH